MRTLITLVFGAALGAVAASLLAPETGEELRRQVENTANRNADALQEAWKRDMEELNERVSNLQSVIQEYVSSPEDTVDDATLEDDATVEAAVEVEDDAA